MDRRSNEQPVLRRFGRVIAGLAPARLMKWALRPENALFAALIVLHVIPVWVFTYLPSQDGPAHLHNASVFRQYQQPELSSFRDYYVINTRPVPNWTSHLLLAALMNLLSPLAAEKVLLTLYVVLFPVSIRYALRAIRPAAGALAVLGFPFIYNYPFHMGFYNFSFSLPMFFLVVGYWAKYRNRFTPRRTVELALLSLLLYFSHLVSLATAWITIAFMMASLALADDPDFLESTTLPARESKWKSVWTRFRGQALAPLLAVVPAALLTLLFLGQQGGGTIQYEPADTQWKSLLVLASLHSLDTKEVWLAKATAVLFAAVAAFLLGGKVMRRHWNGWDGWLVAAGFLAVLYFIVPDQAFGGGYISPRLILYPFFAALLWFGAQSIPRSVRHGIQTAAATIAIGFLLLRLQGYAELNGYLDEYLSGSHLITPNSTLLALPFEHHALAADGNKVSGRIELFANASGYLAVERDVVDLGNYQAMTGYFPVRFRPKLDPQSHIAVKETGFRQQPRRVNFADYHERTGGRVDFVLIWRTQPRSRDPEAARSIFKQLEEGYDLIFTSPQNGFMQLYRRRGWVPDSPEQPMPPPETM